MLSAMCGRLSQGLNWRDIYDEYRLSGRGWMPEPRFNLRPTDRITIVRIGEDGEREAVPAIWWLVPPWAEGPNPKFPMFNARTETLSHKKSFAGPFRSKRCLIPFAGWYEWRAEGKRKQPYFISLESGPFAVAGLWEVSLRAADPIVSCTVITCPANALVAQYHPKQRMPAILRKEDWESWLDVGTVEPEFAQNLLTPWPNEDMTAHMVSPEHVNAATDTPLAARPWGQPQRR
ncbi:MAG: SOS response-associated peptidase [Rhodospirillales bacterium]|nr:SOS response-associated peptidase [Rhodospirillales bacterium]